MRPVTLCQGEGVAEISREVRCQGTSAVVDGKARASTTGLLGLEAVVQAAQKPVEEVGLSGTLPLMRTWLSFDTIATFGSDTMAVT